jgi:hypothetical protein
MSKRLMTAIAGLAVVTVLRAGGALAQTPPAASQATIDAAYSEMNCIYDGLSEDQRMMIFDNYFDPLDEEIEEIDTFMAKLQVSCAARYSWSKDQSGMADGIALHGAVVDVAILDLMDAGLKDGEALFDVWEALPVDDVDHFIDETWYDDKPFNDRMTALLLSAGVPNDALSIENALAVLESISLASAAQDIWLTAKGL